MIEGKEISEITEKQDHPSDKYNLWGGRFETGNDKLMLMFNQSLSVDRRLWEEDLTVCDIHIYMSYKDRNLKK
jgi:argininosuccinate lyase